MVPHEALSEPVPLVGALDVLASQVHTKSERLLRNHVIEGIGQDASIFVLR